jgi:amino acid permease-like protein
MNRQGSSASKRLLLGKPIPSHLAHHERLSRVTGLAVLSPDALSSVACATDFILATLVVAGIEAFHYAIPISLVIAALLAIVAISYRQTIHADPTGGGAYIVSKENITPTAGLVAAASVLVDCTLTVSVSSSAGVLAITSAAPPLVSYRVEICLGFLALLMLGNLRGIRESGRIFAIPTCCTTSARSSPRARCCSGRTRSGRACRFTWRARQLRLSPALRLGDDAIFSAPCGWFRGSLCGGAPARGLASRRSRTSA